MLKEWALNWGLLQENFDEQKAIKSGKNVDSRGEESEAITK